MNGIRRLLTIAILLGLLPGVAVRAADPDVLEATPTIHAPKLDEVKQQAQAWLTARQADDAARAASEVIWQTEGGPYATSAALDRLVATYALVEPQAKAMIVLCSAPRDKRVTPTQDWLKAEGLDPALRNNARLYYGRWLSQQKLFDESLEQLKDLQPADVVEPATLLFFQSVAYHRLLNKQDGMKTIERLLTEVADGPPRYVAVAGLMREDLKALEDESLDHIARRMDDVRRRLDLGRAGEKVRKQEDGVIASLDKLIEDLEKQQQQQSQSQSPGSGQQNQSNQAMPDSKLASANGPGNTDKKNIGRGAGWGDLPAKQREEALQQIGKDFPSHYRDVIEQYFKKLASEEGGEK